MTARAQSTAPHHRWTAPAWAIRANRPACRGQAIVEAALITPLLLLLLIGIIDFGRLFYFDVATRNAVREGARYAIDVTRTNSEVQAAVSAAAPGVTLSPITIAPSTRTSTTTGAVTVTATYTFVPWTPGISSLVGTSLAVTRSATMLIL